MSWKSIVFQYALKPKTRETFQSILDEAVKDKEAYRSFLLRYDIYTSKVWLNALRGVDYVFFYHDVGPDFDEKSQLFPDSNHPFDRWLRHSLESVYDTKSIVVEGYSLPVMEFYAISPLCDVGGDK